MLTVEIDNQSGRVVFVQGSVSGLPAAQQVAKGASVKFTVTDVEAGRIFLSFDKALSSSAPDGANPADKDYKTRFEKVEITYTGGNGKANLTAVDFYAIPLMLQTFIHAADGVATPVEQFSLSPGSTGAQAETALLAAAADQAKATVKNGAETVRVQSPVKAPDAYPSISSYVNAIVAGVKTFKIGGMYYGAPAKDYDYTGAVDAANITLTMASEKSIAIPIASLPEAIYTCNGVYYLDGDTTKPHRVTDNDFNAAVYRDVVSAFNFGYIGGNSGENSSAWWGHPPFAPVNKFYNKYAAAVYAAYPGAYGFPFSDREQIVLADLGGGVDTMRITVLSDTAAPSFLPVPGVLNPKTGPVSFNLIPVFANDINNHVITVGTTACKAGWINDYTTGPKTQIPQGDAAQISQLPCCRGLEPLRLHHRAGKIPGHRQGHRRQDRVGDHLRRRQFQLEREGQQSLHRRPRHL